MVLVGVLLWNSAEGPAQPQALDAVGMDRSAPDGVRTGRSPASSFMGGRQPVGWGRILLDVVRSGC